jgi:hypothetical protein
VAGNAIGVGLGVAVAGRATGVTAGVAVGVRAGVGLGGALNVGVGEGVGLGVGDGVRVGVGVLSSVLVNTHFTTFSSASSLMVALPAAMSPSLLSSSQTMEVRLKPAGGLTSKEK